MIKEIRYTDVLWDFDGTLFNTYPGMVNAFRLALLDSGVEADPEEILGFMKVSARDAAKHYSGMYQLREDFMEKFQAYHRNVKPESAIPFNYAKEICEGIVSAGGRNFIVTHRGGTTQKFLKYQGMLDLFTEIVTKHNGFKRKPHPEAFLYLIEKYHISKGEALIVGDREYEILAAKEAGVRSCLYDTNNIVSSVMPDYNITSLKELENIIGGK
ncbi:haloacid dehalogenase superfamily, subfamily IA, variant 3 with third motif having DD or ED/haloacid dehalogenase superfamily, subfamily IA, variant 1 with third motif having Dx(3-4)D or Dx(3-4)E [Clostridium amylolyticum]|uniref:Haloacid dehalogenase superfamily, subfamily IA, variant 3 with third motif having DD or ED/haloacid dehalogenase superfamily, subfamily IA, variant 1 with third motif having Dx(3-4)D or Dx(3-4)E n=1 Tax=Clostridium amylolyticum TaxID=1121298 RepID=A0A1M6LN00_9CLOT|nr:HAD-IA family hydrolase [Clostridium amylolyticum]SHJ72609.1 haloacid dehalogenase superfamily, subfamily IA, variant 3 with third motif having DD or ED/haloacid dehalogenase superfamily, subfamily IA, variant 1 with third motif having Dx(3-4)D or Dx(3-4)E [Clostridium amylolyticum]